MPIAQTLVRAARPVPPAFSCSGLLKCLEQPLKSVPNHCSSAPESAFKLFRKTLHTRLRPASSICARLPPAPLIQRRSDALRRTAFDELEATS